MCELVFRANSYEATRQCGWHRLFHGAQRTAPRRCRQLRAELPVPTATRAALEPS